jgi:CheY-like chemotaxis protein
MTATIFVIDNSPAVRRMVEQISAPEGYEVIGFQDGPAALEAARRIGPAMIIADYHLDHMTFSGFCKEISKLDNLTETSILSLLDASDRIDESHLRSLGVRGFLKKPFQSDHLLEAIKNLDKGLSKNGLHPPASKKRTWPPDSMTTDLDDEDATTTALACDAAGGAEPAEEPLMTPSASSLIPNTIPAKSSASRTGDGEEALKGFFDHLLQTVSRQVEAKIVDLIPAVIAKELSLQVAKAMEKAVEDEVARRVATSLSPDRIKTLVRDMLVEELPKQAASYLSTLDNTVKQTLSETAPPLIKQTSERLIREQIESELDKHVVGAVRDHLGPVEVLVKNEVQQVVSHCARRTTEDLVREMAQEPIQQAVRKMIPEIAEAQVKEEIKRLTTQA